MSGATKTAPRDQWIERRRHLITATDVPVILGVSKYKSPFTLYHEKRGQAPVREETLAMRLGIAMQGIVGDEYTRETGRELEEHDQYDCVVHPDHDWLGATPDFRVKATPVPVETKYLGEFRAKEFGDGEAPIDYDLQLQTQIAVLGAEWGSLAGLVGNRKLHIVDRDRNDRLIGAMIPKLREFWERVQQGDPPPVDGSDSTASTLAFLHPRDNGEIAYLAADHGEWINRLELAKADIVAAEMRKDEAANALREAIGDATWGVLGDGRCYSWKWQSRKGYLKVPADQVAALLAAGIRFDETKGSEFRVLRSAKAPKL